jgi:RNA-directed DNA polymerase
VNTIPRFRKQISTWLKAGITFEGVTEPNTQGTFQEGPISPLLANIALHGLENHVAECLARWSKKGELPKGSTASNDLMVRYADNFVILYPDVEVLERVVAEVEKWLIPQGLKISNQKSTIRHTLQKYKGNNAGFSFLGFYFSHKECEIGKMTCIANESKREPLRYYLRQTPDQEIVQRHIDNIRDIVKRMEKRPQEELIATLNPIIRGWINYYAFTDNKETFRYCDERMFWRLHRYACNRHKSKGKKWITLKYFHSFEGRKWIFSTADRKHRILLYSKGVGRNV